MDPEIEMYGDYLREKIAEIQAALEPLSEADLNRAPNVPGLNSPFVIATHTLGNIRAWVLGLGCGQDLRRDRPAEFASRGTHDDIAVAARALSGAIDEALRKLDPASLNDRFVAAQELFGEGKTREISRREALFHPVEHAGIHLGHIHLTVDMLKVGI